MLPKQLKVDEFYPHLDAVVSPINVIAEKEIVGGRWVPSDLKQLHQVEELTVYIATDCKL